MSDLERIEKEAKERQNERIRQYRGQLDIDGTTMLFQQLQLAEAAVDELIAILKETQDLLDKTAEQHDLTLKDWSDVVARLSDVQEQRDEALAMVKFQEHQTVDWMNRYQGMTDALRSMCEERDEARALADQLALVLNRTAYGYASGRGQALDAYEKRSWK